MTCWARYKYSESDPAFRVHVWDIFDEALMETKNFDSFFERIWEKLKQIYADQEWAIGQIEVVNDCESDDDKASDDSAHEQLMNAIYKVTNTNLLDTKEGQKYFNTEDQNINDVYSVDNMKVVSPDLPDE